MIFFLYEMGGEEKVLLFYDLTERLSKTVTETEADSAFETNEEETNLMIDNAEKWLLHYGESKLIS